MSQVYGKVFSSSRVKLVFQSLALDRLLALAKDTSYHKSGKALDTSLRRTSLKKIRSPMSGVVRKVVDGLNLISSDEQVSPQKGLQ